MLGNHQRAEDVVQDAFVKLAQHAPTFRGEDGRALRAWLVKTVRNRCLDVRGSAASRLERSGDAATEVDTAPPADAELDRDLSPELATALAGLTHEQRTALVLVHVAGFSGAEVGEVLGKNRAAVYALVRRAERAVRTRLLAPVG